MWLCRWYQGLKMSFQDKPRSPHPFMGGSMSPIYTNSANEVSNSLFYRKQLIVFDIKNIKADSCVKPAVAIVECSKAIHKIAFLFKMPCIREIILNHLNYFSCMRFFSFYD